MSKIQLKMAVKPIPVLFQAYQLFLEFSLHKHDQCLSFALTLPK